MNLTEKQTFFKSANKTASKKKINRANKKVPQHILDQIEQGVTIEKIDELLQKENIPIFHYETQITIHGLFPELSTNRLWGYKNLIQNKNKSIGIRYSAIDEEKRRQIHESLRFAGFRYNRKSNGHEFIKIYQTSKENLKSKIEEIKPFYNQIDTSKIWGNKQIYGGNYLGLYFLVISINVGAIYQKDVQSFIDSIISPEQVKEEKEKEQKIRDEFEKKKQLEKEKEKEKEQKEMQRPEVQELKDNYQFYKGEPRVGKYIRLRFNFNSELIFEAINVYKEGNKKLLRRNSGDFKTLQEAFDYLDTNPQDDLFASKCRKVIGYIIE